MKICILNYSGNTGKTTLAKHLFGAMLPPNTHRISIEDLNATDDAVDVEIAANQFKNLAAEMLADFNNHFVVDVGASNSKLMMSNFEMLSTLRSDIDLWIVPVTASIKQRTDTIATIRDLIKMGVTPSKVVALPNMIADVESFESDFNDLATAASKTGFRVSSEAVLYSDLYGALNGTGETVKVVAASDVNLKKARALSREGKPDEALAMSQRIVLRDQAVLVQRNLDAVLSAIGVEDMLLAESDA